MLRLLSALLLICSAAYPADDKELLAQFIAWYKTYSGSLMPPDVAKAYSAELAGQGLPAGDVRARLASIQKIVATSPPEFFTVHFNKVFTAEQKMFTTKPNAFLVRMTADLKPGTALDAAMGEGRNSVYLAGKGWEVTGYDLSDQGLALARANAATAGVSVKTVMSTHADFDYGQAQWDLIVMTYAFVNMSDEAFLKRVYDSLKPGGMVLVEQLNSGSMAKGPKNALFGSFKELRVLHYEDTIDTADWSMSQSRIGRIAAQKE
jgi:2-polyprenyl-3-methyl-5-hydroxy-6-metoxy-1,4-benzoquinol methylase